MTVYELMKLNERLLTLMSAINIRAEDCAYLPIYEEYREMKAKGDKVTYIVTYLSEKYKVSERTLYRAFSCYTREVDVDK